MQYIFHLILWSNLVEIVHIMSLVITSKFIRKTIALMRLELSIFVLREIVWNRENAPFFAQQKYRSENIEPMWDLSWLKKKIKLLFWHSLTSCKRCSKWSVNFCIWILRNSSKHTEASFFKVFYVSQFCFSVYLANANFIYFRSIASCRFRIHILEYISHFDVKKKKNLPATYDWSGCDWTKA